MPNDQWLEEFLWRGHPDGTTSFHIVIGAMTTDPFSGEQHPAFKGPLTIEQAQSVGYDLTTIIENINTVTLADNHNLKEQIVALEAQLND